MQIDFHTARNAPVVRRREARSFVIPLMAKRLIGLSVALVGLVLVLGSVFSLLLSKSNAPYALILFEQIEKEKPQTNTYIIWVNEEKSILQRTVIPNPLEFHSQSLGTYPIESVYAAHKTTRQPTEDFLTDLSFYFRFPIRAVVYTDGDVGTSKLSLSSLILQSCTRGTSSLGLQECLHTAMFFAGFGTSLRELSFPQSALGTGRVDTIRSLDREKYREWSQKNFSESFKSWGKYTVAVLNGTKTSGLATTASNIIADFGLTLLYIGETQQPQESGAIIISSKANAETSIADFLQSTLKLPVTIDDTLPTQYRSDVVVTIGEKEAKFFTP